MNKRQIEKAARLYALAVVACADAGGAETVDESAVMEAAMDQCRKRLALLGYDYPALGSLQSCMGAASQPPGAAAPKGGE